MIEVVPGFKIYDTMDWSAIPSKGATSVLPYAAKGIVNHHMDWPNRATLNDPKAALAKAFEIARNCQQGHFQNGWIDTGQHFTVTIDGIILEGRHGSLSTSYQGKSVIRGAHCADPGHNVNRNDWIGIEHEGTFTNLPMNSKQWAASVALQAWLCITYKLDSATLIGHRDSGCSTACPGDWFHSNLDKMRNEVHAKKLAIIETLRLNKKAEQS